MDLNVIGLPIFVFNTKLLLTDMEWALVLVVKFVCAECARKKAIPPCSFVQAG
jgi:hypothetical protein